MIKAVFIDFYGTVVHEDGEVIRKISQEIFNTGIAKNLSDIDSYWWKAFQAACNSAYGDSFKTQRQLEYQSLHETIQYFHSTADAKRLCSLMFDHWVSPPIFEESKQFFDICPVPAYIVSNIDRADILKAISFHGLNPAGVFTSEDAKSYKPRTELFEFALKHTGLSARQVIHVGDSLSSDVRGASSAGINAIWINRTGKEIPTGVRAIENLLFLFSKYKLYKQHITNSAAGN